MANFICRVIFVSSAALPLNQGPKLSQNAILVTDDIQAAYTNIPHEDGVKVLEEILNERTHQKVLSGFVARLMELILKNNLFEFNGDLFKQLIGTAMGTHPAPNYANIYLTKRIDDKIIEFAQVEVDTRLS